MLVTVFIALLIPMSLVSLIIAITNFYKWKKNENDINLSRAFKGSASFLLSSGYGVLLFLLKDWLNSMFSDLFSTLNLNQFKMNTDFFAFSNPLYWFFLIVLCSLIFMAGRRS